LKRILLILVTLCLTVNVYGQLFHLFPEVDRFLDTVFEKQPLHSYEIGASLQKSLFLEMGLMHATDINGDDEGTDGTMFAYKVAYVIEPFQTHIIQAPKIGAEANLFFLTLRTSAVYYSGRQDYAIHNDFRFAPEIGLTYVGVVTICYGWNIPLLKDRLTSIAAHFWSININLVDIDL
jgi:hypothetical protein